MYFCNTLCMYPELHVANKADRLAADARGKLVQQGQQSGKLWHMAAASSAADADSDQCCSRLYRPHQRLAVCLVNPKPAVKHTDYIAQSRITSHRCAQRHCEHTLLQCITSLAAAFSRPTTPHEIKVRRLCGMQGVAPLHDDDDSHGGAALHCM